MKWINPWKRAAQLERENQRLRDCLKHEERAAIVRYMRKEGTVYKSEWMISVDPNTMRIADAIERGAHHERNGHEGE